MKKMILNDEPRAYRVRWEFDIASTSPQHAAREVAQMHRGYDGLFKHMTAAQIEARMLAERETARRFIRANRSKIAAQV